MKLQHGLHLAYCTNIHRGESWEEIFQNLKQHTLAVRHRVAPEQPYAIGLRLGYAAAMELNQRAKLEAFKRWLEENDCYVFTINGFPYGTFHGVRVKEDVYRPDWTTPERLEYTNLLFDILVELLPEGVEGSVSSVPVSYKEFITNERQLKAARKHLWKCIDHIEQLSARTGKKLHLGLEPEPMCYLETTLETVRFFDQMRGERKADMRIEEHLGVNYDCCHLAVEYENPHEALGRLVNHGIKVSKIHLSSALKVRPTPEVRQALAKYADDVYFHQVIERRTGGSLMRYRDLPDALASGAKQGSHVPEEWRIHFHIPLHHLPVGLFDSTTDHLLGTLDFLKANPRLCSHLEMETYTWEVMPESMKQRSVVDQLADEYQWTLEQLDRHGLAQHS
ncbi:MAG: metabolite traffic protein EboE [Verrucomicrobiota bacterium]|nr:metabolite traffic protein EboE [Verrucomicrobiota bacterium]